MIIGNGDIANAIDDIDCPEDVLFFASGVSNSQCTDRKQFDREHNLLLVQSRHNHLVYFSSLCIYHSTTAYADHKYAMEELIRIAFEKYTIVRLGNITWGNNQNTLINYLRSRIQNQLPYDMADVYRFIINKEHFLSAVQYAIDKRLPELNIRGERLKVAEIVQRIKDGKL